MAMGCYWIINTKWYLYVCEDDELIYLCFTSFGMIFPCIQNKNKIKSLSLLNPESQETAFMPKRGVGNNPYIKDVFVAKLWIILITLGLAKTFKTKNNQVSSIFSSKDWVHRSFKKPKISNLAILQINSYNYVMEKNYQR